jgi:hypothetical protein
LRAEKCWQDGQKPGRARESNATGVEKGLGDGVEEEKIARGNQQSNKTRLDNARRT